MSEFFVDQIVYWQAIGAVGRIVAPSNFDDGCWVVQFDKAKMRLRQEELVPYEFTDPESPSTTATGGISWPGDQ